MYLFLFVLHVWQEFNMFLRLVTDCGNVRRFHIWGVGDIPFTPSSLYIYLLPLSINWAYMQGMISSKCWLCYQQKRGENKRTILPEKTIISCDEVIYLGPGAMCRAARLWTWFLGACINGQLRYDAREPHWLWGLFDINSVSAIKCMVKNRCNMK